jgi:hypothetical protein
MNRSDISEILCSIVFLTLLSLTVFLLLSL